MDLSKVKCLVVDNGLFVELACRLARDYGQVWYYTPWEQSFPLMNHGRIGEGMDGIERVSSVFGPHFEDVDLFVFPDVFHGELQVYLESIGKRVWGARRGEELELEREATKGLLEDLGLPVTPWASVRGMNALRAHLKQHENKYVKLSFWRGTTETFHAANYREIEPKLDELQYLLGRFGESTRFVVEDPVRDAVEFGMDAYTIDGKFPQRMLSGIEVKDQAYVGVFHEYAKLPKPLRTFNDKIAGTLKRYGYRGFASYESRLPDALTAYMIDFCARCGSPPSELYAEFYENIAEIVAAGADGELVEPVPLAKYGAWCIIESHWADKNWQPVDFPEELRRNVKLRNAVKIDGRYYAVPQREDLSSVGAVVGWGETMDAAMQMVKDVAGEVEGYSIKVPVGAFDDAQAEIDKLTEFGVEVFA